MRLKADFHLHTDEYRGHGENPRALAEAVVSHGFDLVAITEHRQVRGRYFQFLEALEEISGQRGRPAPRAFLGVELNLKYGRPNYHVGYIFEENFTPENLPEVPEQHSHVDSINTLRAEHPGLAIMFHPTWRDKRRGSAEVTEELMGSGLFDGIEMFRRIDPPLRKKGKPLAAFGCSDAHRAHHVGGIYTEMDLAYREQSTWDAIRQGRTKAICSVNHGIRERLRSIPHQGKIAFK